MNFRIRAGRESDLRSFYNLAKLTGGGFTNLPAEKATLEAKLATSAAGFAREGDTPGDDLYVFMLENIETKQIRGTCQVFGAVGTQHPFYSYLISTLTQKSGELGKTFRNQLLNLTTDLEGSSEVGGLFLHPNERAGGLGLLLARSRYLFIKMHRARFGEIVLAELRGVMDEGGHSPFWDAIGGRFFDMTFPEADEFNAIHGTQFIADLFPKSAIYMSMLPESARAVIGQPHPTGKAALKMLEIEGFVLGFIRRHIRRRPDGDIANRQHPDDPRSADAVCAGPRAGEWPANAGCARAPGGFRRLLRQSGGRRRRRSCRL